VRAALEPGPGERAPVAAALLLLAVVPTAWLLTWVARGVSTPAAGGAEDFPYAAVLAIGLAAPPIVAAGLVLATRRGWRELVGATALTVLATLALWLGGRILMLWPGWMTYVCTNETTGPHLLFRRLTTLALLRPDGGYRGQAYGAGPAVAGVAAIAVYAAGGLWAFRDRRRTVWAWPAAGLAALVVWTAVLILIEGAPDHCTT
jgi:hypothetical protein